MVRRDFAYPFRIDAASGQAAQAAYQDHVDQMIRQILLTDPGERVCLPDFGAAPTLRENRGYTQKELLTNISISFTVYWS